VIRLQRAPDLRPPLFDEHGMHRLYERLGFRCGARLVEADWFKGEWTTLRVYAILRRERATPPS
jgi:RimJ/RimL family protein N-acetyltransferase